LVKKEQKNGRKIGLAPGRGKLQLAMAKDWQEVLSAVIPLWQSKYIGNNKASPPANVA
jgi:hypothetical protein